MRRRFESCRGRYAAVGAPAATAASPSRVRVPALSERPWMLLVSRDPRYPVLWRVDISSGTGSLTTSRVRSQVTGGIPHWIPDKAGPIPTSRVPSHAEPGGSSDTSHALADICKRECVSGLIARFRDSTDCQGLRRFIVCRRTLPRACQDSSRFVAGVLRSEAPTALVSVAAWW